MPTILVDYKGIQILDPAPTADAGLALHSNFMELADRIGPCNYSAVEDPVATNDTTEGYEVGSFWLNNATDEVFFCTDNTEDAAVWTNLSTGNSGGGGDFVPTSRTVSTSAPLTGGGSLATNLNLGINIAGPATTGALLAADWVAFANKAAAIHAHAAADITSGIFAVARGGTGANTAAAARTNLLPNKTGNANKVLAVSVDESDYTLITTPAPGGGGTLPFVDVTQAPYNLVGDGETDDAAALQTLMDDIADTGAVVWFPPDRVFALGSQINIKSFYPVWLMGGAGTRAFHGAPALTHTDHSYIRPIAAMDSMFRWTLPTGSGASFDAGGGGMTGIAIADWDDSPTDTVRNHAFAEAAVYVEGCIYWTARDCSFSWLLGSAIKVKVCTILRIRSCQIYSCGNTSKSAVQIGDGVNFCGVYMDDTFLESNMMAPMINIADNSGLTIRSSYFESVLPGVTFIDASGHLLCNNTAFNNTGQTSIILRAVTVPQVANVIRNCMFWNFPGSNPVVQILPNAVYTTMSDCFFANGAEQGRQIDCQAADCNISDIYLSGGGGIVSTGLNVNFSNIKMRGCNRPAGQYAIDLGQDNVLSGGVVDGLNTMPCHGIRLFAATVSGVRVKGLAANTNGIVSTNVSDVINGCSVLGVSGTGIAIVPVQGARLSGNSWAFTVATAVGDTNSSSVTVNTEGGFINTPALTNAEGGTHILTILNGLIADHSRVLVSVGLGQGVGGSTQGAMTVGRVHSSSFGGGAVTIYIHNSPAGLGAWNGHLTVRFQVIN